MNVKIAAGAVTFKVTEAELGQLLQCNNLEINLPLSPVSVKAFIKVAPEESLFFDKEAASLVLGIPLERAQELSDMGKSKKGISFSIVNTEVTLQVDLRADSRKWK